MTKIPGKAIVFISVVLIAAIAVFGWAIYRSSRVGDTGQEMALEIARDTFFEDYPALLIENSHPDFTLAMPEELLVRYLTGLVRQLGPLESLESIEGSTDIPLLSFDQTSYSASYTIGMNFRDAPADLLLQMQFNDGQWLVSKLEVITTELGN